MRKERESNPHACYSGRISNALGSPMPALPWRQEESNLQWAMPGTFTECVRSTRVPPRRRVRESNPAPCYRPLFSRQLDTPNVGPSRGSTNIGVIDSRVTV